MTHTWRPILPATLTDTAPTARATPGGTGERGGLVSGVLGRRARGRSGHRSTWRDESGGFAFAAWGRAPVRARACRASGRVPCASRVRGRLRRVGYGARHGVRAVCVMRHASCESSDIQPGRAVAIAHAGRRKETGVQEAGERISPVERARSHHQWSIAEAVIKATPILLPSAPGAPRGGRRLFRASGCQSAWTACSCEVEVGIIGTRRCRP